MIRNSIFTLVFYFVSIIASAAQIRILFDATKAETAANADWTIDADKYNVGFGTGVPTIGGTGTEANPQRFPTPAQSGITASTPENYWSGALSAWAVECAKKGFVVETLPIGGKITWGDTGNPQDLSLYRVVVFCEPNIAFTAAEKTAIIRFVENGGSLMMVADHDMSDRNFDGIDSPSIFNDLMNNNGIKSNPFGFNFNLDDLSQTTSNIISAGTNPVINGPFGIVSKIKTSGGCSMTVNNAFNSNTQGLVFKNNTQKLQNEVLVAMSQYAKGKIFAIGDSSIPDDGSGDPNDNLYDGWLGDADGNHRKLIMNATVWLATLQPDSIKANIKFLQNTSCAESKNGSIELSVSGGNNVYSFVWSNGATTNPVQSLPAGTYQVTISSSGVAPLVLKSLNISAPNPLSSSITLPALLTCKSKSTELQAKVSGGTEPYTYTWSAGTNNVSNPGTYSLTITDRNGCKTVATTIVKQNTDLPVVLIQNGQITCASPKAVLSANSANQHLKYLWKGPQNFLSERKDTVVWVPGNYALIATDTINGCTTEKYIQVLENSGNAPLSVKLLDKRDATDIPNGFITIEVKDGTVPYQYKWKDAQGNIVGSNAPKLTDLDKGTYTCEVTDANGCKATITAIIGKLLHSIETDFSKHFKLFPNPANEVIYTEFTETLPCSIFSVFGERIKDGCTNQQWEIGNLPKGLYYLKPATDSASAIFFIKN